MITKGFLPNDSFGIGNFGDFSTGVVVKLLKSDSVWS